MRFERNELESIEERLRLIDADDEDVLSALATFLEREVGGDEIWRAVHAIARFAKIELVVRPSFAEPRFDDDDIARHMLRAADVDALDEKLRRVVGEERQRGRT